jgi:hypothetical protein
MRPVRILEYGSPWYLKRVLSAQKGFYTVGFVVVVWIEVELLGVEVG